LETRKFRAFLSKNQFHILYDAPMESEENLHHHAGLGVSLLEFAEMEPGHIRKTFEKLEKHYHLCTLMGDRSPDTMRHSLLHGMKKEIQGNAYLSCFLVNTIIKLYETGVPEDLLEVLAPAFDGMLSRKVLRKYREEELKQIYLRMLPRVIANQQSQLKNELALLWGEEQSMEGFSPEQRLYLLAHTDKSDIYYLKRQTAFSSRLSTVNNYFGLSNDELKNALLQGHAEIFEMYEFSHLDALLGFELNQMVLHKCNVKKCAYCGGWFIPEGRSDSKYCNRIVPGEQKPCCEIGAFRKRSSLVASDPVYRAYTAAVKRMSKRKRQSGGLTETQYRSWAWQAEGKRDQCLEGEIPLTEFEAWLDETSRLNRKRKDAK